MLVGGSAARALHVHATGAISSVASHMMQFPFCTHLLHKDSNMSLCNMLQSLCNMCNMLHKDWPCPLRSRNQEKQNKKSPNPSPNPSCATPHLVAQHPRGVPEATRQD